jgi:hypothetical protein
MQVEQTFSKKIRRPKLGMEAVPWVWPQFDASGSQTLGPCFRSQANSLGATLLSFSRSDPRIAKAAFESSEAVWGDLELSSVFLPFNLEVPTVVAADAQPCEAPADSDLAAILKALDESPIEDGVTHRAEAAIDAHITRVGGALAVRQTRAMASLAQAAAFLRLLGRSERLRPQDRMALVQWGLASESIEVRDAAIQAVENWEDRTLVGLLEKHNDEIPWLSSYAANVARDLGA